MTSPLRRAALLLGLVGILVGTVVVATPAWARASDGQIARRTLITVTDLPGTWTSTPPDQAATTRAEKIAKTIPACKDYLAFTRANTRVVHADSRTFSLGGAELSNGASVYPNVAAANRSMRSLGGFDVAQCLTSTFQKVVDQGLAADPTTRGQVAATVKLEPVSDVPTSLGDDIVAYAGGMTLTLPDGSQQNQILGFIAVRFGRLIDGFTFSAPTGVDVQDPLQAALASSVGRAKDALAP